MSGCSQEDLASRLTRCIRDGECKHIPARVGATALTESQLKALLHNDTVRSALAGTESLEVYTFPEGGKQIQVVSSVGGRRELVFARVLKDGDATIVCPGSLVNALLIAKARQAAPSDMTVKSIYNRAADDFDKIAPAVIASGLEKLDVTLKDIVPTEEYSASLRKLGELNNDRPYRILRPQ